MDFETRARWANITNADLDEVKHKPKLGLPELVLSAIVIAQDGAEEAQERPT